MKLGTRSVLFGYHCVAIHWLFVARGWFHLYGFRRVAIGRRVVQEDLVQHDGVRFPVSYRRTQFTSLLDPRLWIAFLIHDLGYWGSPNMDGEEGERHPLWAGEKMNKWFGAPWGDFCVYHSRFYAKRDGAAPSPLCFADKLAIVYMPDWLYLRMIFATGEVHEYMRNSQRMIAARASHTDAVVWLRDVKRYVRKWVEEFKDGAADTWTPASDAGSGNATRPTETPTGVWK